MIKFIIRCIGVFVFTFCCILATFPIFVTGIYTLLDGLINKKWHQDEWDELIDEWKYYLGKFMKFMTE